MNFTGDSISGAYGFESTRYKCATDIV